MPLWKSDGDHSFEDYLLCYLQWFVGTARQGVSPLSTVQCLRGPGKQVRKMRIKAYFAKQRFVLANLHDVELASLVSAVGMCRANTVKESSSLTHCSGECSVWWFKNYVACLWSNIYKCVFILFMEWHTNSLGQLLPSEKQNKEICPCWHFEALGGQAVHFLWNALVSAFLILDHMSLALKGTPQSLCHIPEGKGLQMCKQADSPV